MEFRIDFVINGDFVYGTKFEQSSFPKLLVIDFIETVIEFSLEIYCC